MVTMIPQIPEPPTPQDPPAQFNQKAADSWAGLYAAVPKMNQQAGEIEQIGAAATAAAGQAAVDSDLALGYKNEAGAARTAAQGAAATAGQHAATAAQAGDDAAQAAVRAEAAAAAAGQRVPMTGMSGAAILPSGPASDRPDLQLYQGQFLLRGNSELGKLEWYDWGALAWKPLGGGSSELFNYAWHNGPRSSIDVGRVATDGQQLLLLTHPDVCQAIWAGEQHAVDESVWQADPTKRNCWSRGDGTSWVRVPDLNAAVAGTGKSFYLRGGTDSLNGSSVGDAIRDIVGTLTPANSAGYISSTGVMAITGGNSGYRAAIQTGESLPVMDFRASRVVPTADENRVKSAYGVWTVRVFTEVSNVGVLDAGQLATQLGVVDAKVQAQDANTGCVTIYPNGTEASPSLITVNTNVVVPNPFPGYKVFCELEVLYGGQWCGIGMSATSTTTSVGAECKPHNNHASLVVQGGITSLIATTNLHYFSGARPGSGTVLNLPFRLVVWKLKGGV